MSQHELIVRDDGRTATVMVDPVTLNDDLPMDIVEALGEAFEGVDQR